MYGVNKMTKLGREVMRYPEKLAKLGDADATYENYVNKLYDIVTVDDYAGTGEFASKQIYLLLEGIGSVKTLAQVYSYIRLQGATDDRFAAAAYVWRQVHSFKHFLVTLWIRKQLALEALADYFNPDVDPAWML